MIGTDGNCVTKISDREIYAGLIAKRNILYSVRIKWDSIPIDLLTQLIEKAKLLGAETMGINYIANDYVLQFFNTKFYDDEKIKSEIDDIVSQINSIHKR